MNEKTTAVRKQLGRLFGCSLGLGSPLYQLQLIREKLEERSLHRLDTEDILGELGSLQHSLGALNGEMLCLNDLLTQQKR